MYGCILCFGPLQVLFWDCFDMYMYMYMHMFGLREPMVLSALKCLGLAGPVIAASKICSHGHAANPKGALCLFLVLSYYG
jgi:hypothetical protein